MKATHLVIDADKRMEPQPYYTEYHAAQMARALNMNEGTQYRMYHGVDRFTVEEVPADAELVKVAKETSAVFARRLEEILK